MLSNELGRLAQGVRDIKENNALTFIQKHNIPTNKKVVNKNIVCDYRPLKEEKFRFRLTIGDDVLEYDNNDSSPASSLLKETLVLNSVISDTSLEARFMTADLKYFFLQ